MCPVLLEVWSLRKRRDKNLVMATDRTLSLHSYEVKVRDVCLGDQMCPGAPNGLCKRGTPRGAVKSQQGKSVGRRTSENQRPKGQPQGASQTPWSGSHKGEIPNE